MKFSKVFQLTKNFTIGEEPKTKLMQTSFPDILMWMTKERDWTLKGFRKHLEKKRMNVIMEINQFQLKEYAQLGPEIHAASYALKFNCRCRMHGSSKWLQLADKQNVDDLLPQEERPGLFVHSLDFTKSILLYEGFSNIEDCTKLEWLSFDGSYFIDDWCLRRLISTQFSDTLTYLDISNCNKIGDDGLISLGYLKNLKKLKMSNLKNAPNKEYIAVLLEDNNPDLEIIGLDHTSDETIKSVEQRLENETQQFKKIKDEAMTNTKTISDDVNKE